METEKVKPEHEKRYSEYFFPSKVTQFVKRQCSQPVVALFVKRGKTQMRDKRGKLVEKHIQQIERVVIG